MLMPARLLNFNVMIAAPLLLGSMAAHRGAAWAAVLAGLSAVGFVFNSQSLWFSDPGGGELSPFQPHPTLVMGLTALALVTASFLWKGNSKPAWGHVSRAIFLGVSLWVGSWAWQMARPRQIAFHNRSTDRCCSWRHRERASS
jgi:hypothetical protein